MQRVTKDFQFLNMQHIPLTEMKTVKCIEFLLEKQTQSLTSESNCHRVETEFDWESISDFDNFP